MGAEAACTCRYKGRTARGTAYLEPNDLLFRGEFRLAIPYDTMTSSNAAAGRLTIVFGGGTAMLELGEKTAARWAAKISDPANRLKKRGVEGSR